jgi:hypothetical protein
MAIGCGPGDFRPCRALVRGADRGFMSQIQQQAARPPAVLARRPRPAGRRIGYLIAVVVNAALLFVLNGQPGWQDVPFLTSATSQVLGLVNLSLAVGLAVNLVYLAYDPPWLKSLGDLLTAAISLAVAIRMWQVFPFAFHGSWAWCATALRVLLIIAMAGCGISIVLQAVSLGRLAIHSAQRGHTSTGH